MIPVFSIIIPVRQENDYVRQTLEHLQNQAFKSFEVLVITDKVSQDSNPASKRNLGARMAKGKYLAFLDDDSYPDRNWLINAHKYLQKEIAVCGPNLTPPEDNYTQQASGLLWTTWLGSGGAGTYRNIPKPARYVDDFPTVNLIVTKNVFEKIGGFRPDYWPGEDTLFCLDLINTTNQKIYYSPDIVVYHHRRSLLLPHLKQISRYALHRGHFARKFPQNSLRLGYLVPSLFSIYLLTLPFTHFFYPLYLYLILLVSSFVFLISENNIVPSLLAILAIPPTHLIYGILFLVGYFKNNLKFSPKKVDRETGHYLSG